MQEKIELDLDNPIFVFYYNVGGLSRQRAQQDMMLLKENFDIYKNATMWLVACKDDQENRIECVYDGRSRNRDMELTELIKEINTRVDILANSKDFDDFKLNIRDWRLETVLKNGDN